MNTIGRIDAFRRLWNVFFPKSGFGVTKASSAEVTLIPCPDDVQISLWLLMAEDDVIEHGLRRLRAKVRYGEITSPESAGRYLTAVLKAESQRRQEVQR
jgi:hypothetical protein